MQRISQRLCAVQLRSDAARFKFLLPFWVAAMADVCGLVVAARTPDTGNFSVALRNAHSNHSYFWAIRHLLSMRASRGLLLSGWPFALLCAVTKNNWRLFFRNQVWNSVQNVGEFALFSTRLFSLSKTHNLPTIDTQLTHLIRLIFSVFCVLTPNSFFSSKRVFLWRKNSFSIFQRPSQMIACSWQTVVLGRQNMLFALLTR